MIKFGKYANYKVLRTLLKQYLAKFKIGCKGNFIGTQIY